MATITNRIAWVDNTDALKTSLLAGISTIDSMKRSVDRTAESLGGSGLFRAANVAVGAIDQLGGATKLTAAELDKQTIKIDKAIEKYDALGQRAPEAMRQLSVELKAASAAAETMADKAERIGASMTKIGGSLQSVGTTLSIGITAPLVALGYTALKASMDFETAFSGVQKTVSATPVELQKLNEGFREMAKVTPVSAAGLAKIGETAGQMGVGQDHLLAFTKTIVDISTATHLTADEAATAFAKLAVVMKVPQSEFEHLGSAVYSLGNFGQSTEKEMLDMAQRIAGAGAAAGFTAPQVLGIANALSSVGIEAEAGGTAISRVIIKMSKDVATGGGHLKDFAAMSGMSAKDFQQAWTKDPGLAFSAFITGLSHVKDQGKSLFLAMDELGFKETRLLNSMLSSAGAANLMRDSMALGTATYADHSKFLEAVQTRYATTENQMKIFANRLDDVRMKLGDALMPILRDFMKAADPLIEWASSAVKWFATLPEPVRLLVVGLVGFVAVIGPALFIIGSFVGALGEIGTALALFSGPAAAGGIAGLVGFLANPIVLGAAIVIGGIALAVYELHKNLSAMEHISNAGKPLEGLLDGNKKPLLSTSSPDVVKANTGDLVTGMTIKMGADFKKVAAEVVVGTTNQVSANSKLLESVKTLTAGQRARIDADKAAGMTAKQIAADTGIAADVIGVYERQTVSAHKETAKAESEHTKALKVLAQAQLDARNAAIPLDEIQVVMATHYRSLGLGITETAVLIGAADIQVKLFVETTKELGTSLGKIRAIESGQPLLGPIKGLGDLVNIHEQLKGITDELTKIHNIESGGGAASMDKLGPLKGEFLFHPKDEEAIVRLKQHTKDWEHALNDVSRAFEEIGRAAGGSLGGIFSAVGQVIQILEQASRVTQQIGRNGQSLGGSFGLGSVLFNSNATGAQRVSAGAQAAAAVAQGAMNVWDATSSHASAMGNAGAGALAGAQAGAAFGPWGIAIGAAAGFFVGLIRGKPEWAKAADEVGRDFGVKIDKALSDQIAKDAKELFHGDRWAAEYNNLANIIQQAGGLTDKNIAQMMGKLHDVFSLIELNRLTAVQGAKIIDDNWDAFAKQGTNAYGQISDKLREIIDLDERFGTHSKAIAAWKTGQAADMASGLAGLLTQPMIANAEAVGKAVTDAQKAVDDAKEKLADSDAKQAASGAGGPTDKQAAAIKKAEQTLAGAQSKQAQTDTIAHYKAVEAAQKALDKAREAASNTSATSGAKDLALTDALTKAQDTLTEALTVQHREAERNKQALADLGTIALTTFNAAIASGSTFAQALKAISPQLDLIAKAYKNLGLVVDDPALKGLLIENTILNGAGGTGQAVSGLQQIITAGMNLGKGIETPEAFAAQQRTLGSLYTQTQSATEQAGGTTINALLPFQQTLHELQDWAKKQGLDLDENTKEMIRQSDELGIWHDMEKTDGEKTRDSIAQLILSQDRLAAALGGKPYTPPGTTGATGTNAPGPGADPGGWRSGDTDPHAPPTWPMAGGGFGFASRPMTFTTQGNEEYAFSGEGRRFSRGPSSGFLKGDGNDGLSTAAGGDTYQITIHAVDAASFEQLLNRNAASVAGAVTKAVRYNKGGAHTKLRAELGVS